jgi:hypothetical protein
MDLVFTQPSLALDSSQQKSTSNTLEFGKTHYKCRNGIKSTFIPENIKQTKENINQIPWGS